jgi:anaerobic magnesium-protoporphyrin IX monomethyl ester cyclase
MNKKILLINPAWKVENRSNLWRKVASCYPSIGLAYIASVLEQYGHEVVYLDMHAEGFSLADVSSFCDSELLKGLDFVGITATTPLINCAYALCEIFKQRFPDVKTVLGGVHPSVLPEEALLQRHVDFVVRCEGEFAMRDLVGGVAPRDILGLSYKDREGIHHNSDRPEIANLDNLPPPAFHLMPIKKYRPAIGSYKRLPAMSIFATRGCPGRCTFCHRTFRGKIRSRSAKKIVEDIKMLMRDYGIREISFYDDTFTALKKNVQDFCNILLEENIDISWSCFTRTNYVDESLFGLMKKAGCHQIMMGVESGVQEILDGMNKNVTLKQIREAVRICKKVGLEIRAAYIFGNVGETKEMMQKTLDFAIELDTDYAQFNILTAYPGTDLWDTAEKNGWLRVKGYNYSVSDMTLEMPFASQKDIMDMYSLAHKKYYGRPNVILRRLWKLRSWAQARQEVLGALAIFGDVD